MILYVSLMIIYMSYTLLALKRCITSSHSLDITGPLLYLEYCDDIYNLVRLRQISCLSLYQWIRFYNSVSG